MGTSPKLLSWSEQWAEPLDPSSPNVPLRPCPIVHTSVPAYALCVRFPKMLRGQHQNKVQNVAVDTKHTHSRIHTHTRGEADPEYETEEYDDAITCDGILGYNYHSKLVGLHRLSWH